MKKFKIVASEFKNPQLSKVAVQIADMLSDWAGEVADLPNREDYLDNYDDEAIGNTIDALYDFAKYYATDMREVK